MQTIIKLEELAKLILAYAGSLWLGYSWWVFLAWLLVPDLSMIGYLVNTKLGAICYNFVHHQGVAVCVFIVGYLCAHHGIMLAGAVLFGHSSMDRIFGYGLKLMDDFHHTHLGWIGKDHNGNADR